MIELTPMYVLTVKRDGGTQDVRAFYTEKELISALMECERFLRASRLSRRAIVRLEWYNPQGAATGRFEPDKAANRLDSPAASGTIEPSHSP